MIKAAFFDLDGTLMNEKGQVSTSTRQAIKDLRQKGIKVLLATGRHLTEIEATPVNQMTFAGYVTLNGQICLDQKRQVLSSHPIAARDAAQLIKFFQQRQAPCLLVQKEKMYLNFVNDTVKKVQRAISTPVPDVALYQSGPIYQACVYGDDHILQTVMQNLTTCRLTKWNHFGADIISKTGGKMKGIKFFTRYFALKPQEIIAFGDGQNDIDMLNYVGLGVAMGNASQAVKDGADYVTTDINDDGIAHALRRFKILD